MSDNVLLQVDGLKKYFAIERGLLRRSVGEIRAVDDVSFQIHEGETLGLVGESGCGKTTLGRCIVRAIEPTGGIIGLKLNGSVTRMDELHGVELRKVRQHIQMIFQDPYASLDPRMTVMEIIGEPIRANKLLEGKAYEDRIKYLMKVVGLETKHLKRYPHAFSGGQRQRIGIARALSTNPRMVVADEPVSALDVSVQAQILNLLQDLQKEFKLTFLFISHDLSVIEHIADRVGVMYVGLLVELGQTEDLFLRPLHPYTEALLSAIPRAEMKERRNRIILPGEVANPADPPSGCYFHPRCLYAQEICRTKHPPLREVRPGQHAACHFAGELDLKGVAETGDSLGSTKK